MDCHIPDFSPTLKFYSDSSPTILRLNSDSLLVSPILFLSYPVRTIFYPLLSSPFFCPVLPFSFFPYPSYFPYLRLMVTTTATP